MQSRLLSLSACIMILAQHTASAQEYPFAGPHMLLPLDELIAQRRALACTGSFILQNSDGSYRAYHLDPQTLSEDQQLCYRIWEAGTCSYDSVTKIETCEIEKSVYGVSTEYGRFFGDDPDDIEVVYGSTLDEVMQSEPTAQSVHCSFTDDIIARYLSDQWTDYPEEVVDALSFDDPTPHQALLKLAGKIVAEDDGDWICAPN